VKDITNTFKDMHQKILKRPENEKELANLKGYLKDAERNMELQKERLFKVGEHLDLIEDFYLIKYDVKHLNLN
jgi:hypothetical protein